MEIKAKHGVNQVSYLLRFVCVYTLSAHKFQHVQSFKSITKRPKMLKEKVPGVPGFHLQSAKVNMPSRDRQECLPCPNSTITPEMLFCLFMEEDGSDRDRKRRKTRDIQLCKVQRREHPR